MPLPAVSHWRHTVYGLSIRVFVCPSVWPSVHAWLCVKSLWPRHLTAVQLQLHRARLVLGWVTVFGFSSRCRSFISVCDQPPRSTQSGHPFVGRCSEYQPKMYRVRFWGQRSRSRPNVVKKGQGILKVVHSNRVWSQTVRVRAPPPPPRPWNLGFAPELEPESLFWRRPWLWARSVSSGLLCNFVAVYLTFVQFILQRKLRLYTIVHLLLEEFRILSSHP